MINPIVELSLTFHNAVVGANGQRQAMFIERVEGFAEEILKNWQFGKNDILDIPANMKALEATFEALEPGSTAHLRHFLAQAAYKYQVGMGEYVFRPSLSITEFIDWRLIRESIGLQSNWRRSQVASRPRCLVSRCGIPSSNDL